MCALHLCVLRFWSFPGYVNTLNCSFFRTLQLPVTILNMENILLYGLRFQNKLSHTLILHLTCTVLILDLMLLVGWVIIEIHFTGREVGAVLPYLTKPPHTLSNFPRCLVGWARLRWGLLYTCCVGRGFTCSGLL